MTSADDELVWGLTSGSMLTATTDMLMEDSGDRAFTAGQSYRVDSMHPLAHPPFVRVKDDQGVSHRLHAGDIRTYFGR